MPEVLAQTRDSFASSRSPAAGVRWQMRCEEVAVVCVPLLVEEGLYLGGAVPSRLPTPSAEVVTADDTVCGLPPLASMGAGRIAAA